MNTLPAIGEDAVVIETQPQTERASDAVLIERSWREPDVFAAVFDRYYVELHGFVARRLGHGRADDLASETFLIAFDRRRRYDVAYPDARPWLYGIASNLIARHRRAELRQLRALARADRREVVVDDRVDGRLDAQAQRGRLAAALLEIADRDREVLLLWDAGLSYAEIAEQTGLALGAIGTTLARARRRLVEAYATLEEKHVARG